ncbi:MAG: hypothetical protein AWU58_2163 [Methanohalophilus sp. T328-1]|nr:MAG: hypothetical protein AWU58_2163 [Methanohalophilus sp. T328-1]
MKKTKFNLDWPMRLKVMKFEFHSYLSLAFVWAFLIISLTGIPLIFETSLQSSYSAEICNMPLSGVIKY